MVKILFYNPVMPEGDNAARKATTTEYARRVISFCESRTRVSVALVSPVVNFNGEEVVGFNLVLQGGRKANHLRTTVFAFGQAVASVSRNAWDYNLTPEGRRLLKNIVNIGQTSPSTNNQSTIFDLTLQQKRR